MGAVGLDELTGLPSRRLGEWASGYCRAGHSCRCTGARSGVGCEGKIEKSIMRGRAKKKKKEKRG